MLLLIIFILGLAIGSFINVAVIRLAVGEKLNGRSHCRDCGVILAWYHNIPVFSFLCLQGRCAFCRRTISWQYPLVELATGLVFVLGAYYMPADDWWWLLTYLVLAAWAVILFVFDFRFKVLPDIITLSGTAILFMLNLMRGQSLVSLLTAILAGTGFFTVQYFISRGRWIGAGDIRLGALMGAALGWPQVAVAVVLAYWLGAAVGLALLFNKKYSLKSELAFGTFLTAAALVVFIWGEEMVSWYWRLVS